MQKRSTGVNVRAALGVSLGAVLMGSVWSAALPAQAAEGCASHEARRSLEVRVLQSELMVAALTCGERQSYTAFVTTFKPFLKSQSAELRDFFVKQYGLAAGPNRLNNMVTRLANTASQNSVNVSTQEFCTQAKALFASVLNTNTQGLLQIARANPSAMGHGFRSCVEVADTSGDQPKAGSN